MQLPSDQDLSWFDRMGKARPTHDEHGVVDTRENPLSEQLISGKPRNWRMVGNMLHCDTDFGPMAQRIDPAYICLGEKDGLPILKKVV